MAIFLGLESYRLERIAICMEALSTESWIKQFEHAQCNRQAAEHAVRFGKKSSFSHLIRWDQIVRRGVNIIDIFTNRLADQVVHIKLGKHHGETILSIRIRSSGYGYPCLNHHPLRVG